MTAFGALSRAHYKGFFREKVALFFTFLFPLMFILIFGSLFGKNDAGGGRRVIDLMGPGVMCWGVGTTAAFGAAYTIVQWRNNDILRLVQLTPTSISTVMVSRLIVAIGVALVQAVFFIGVSTIPFFAMKISGAGVLLALPVLILGVVAFFAIGVLVARLAKSPDAVAAIANGVMIPMMFLSGTFFPLEQSPAWLRAVSWILPLRYMNQGISEVLGGNHGAGAIVVPCTGLIAFTLLFGFVARSTFVWSDRR